MGGCNTGGSRQKSIGSGDGEKDGDGDSKRDSDVDGQKGAKTKDQDDGCGTAGLQDVAQSKSTQKD